jgi:dGTPase
MTVREQLEAREKEILGPQAFCSCDSQGRAIAEAEDNYRTVFQRDRDRIIHTKAFRRLKRKTQVFLAPEGDHYRTRLTHTLEVSQIARTIARALFLNEDLAEAIAMGHDLGHPPFGHAGEKILNKLFSGGFHHSRQSLRVVDVLEKRHSGKGLNLTQEVRDGIRYHSAGKTILKGKIPRHPATREGLVVSISDAIAYINHDIDDALRAGVLTLEQLPEKAVACLGQTSSARIDRMVVGVIEGSRHGNFDIVPEVKEGINTLRDYLYTQIYPCENIDREIRKAMKLLEALCLHLLDNPVKEIIDGDPQDSLELRTIDFVAGMTDEFAIRLYHQLLMPGPWSNG